MIPQDFSIGRRARRPAAMLALIGLGGMAMLLLQACSTANMPQPKYPIYMQDKPAEVVGGEAVGSVAQPDEDVPPPMTKPSPSGSVQVTDLAPPPPPPPPPEMLSPATSAATAPVRDARAAYVYVLQPHDTLYGISRRFGVPVKELYAINGLAPDAGLRIGQKVLLPATAVDKGVEDHANGTGMVRLATALTAAAKVPEKPVEKPVAPAAAKPVVAQVTSKPVVAEPAAAKPVVKPAPVVSVAGFPSNTQITHMGKGLFVWPVKGRILVPFGQLAPNVRNDGINIAATAGTDIKAAAAGVVVYEGDQVKELGNTIYIKHADGWYTGYSHLRSMTVKNNEAVTKGQVIGTAGQTGVIDQPQLHFEIRYTPSTDIARPIDPALVLP